MANVLTSARPRLTDWRDYVTLLKPRVMSLVVFTGLCGLLAAPGHLPPALAFTAILCIAVGAGAAGAFNMWYEAESDALMRRTASRPLPAGRLGPEDALAFAVTLAAGAVMVMGLALNLLAAGLLLGSILFYSLIYTVWLKRRTPQNIVIGGAAGAFPPVIGWAAVTGHTGTMPWLLFALIFAWTPPHFWSMALFSRGDYARAGIPMLPVVAGETTTRRQIFAYTVLMIAISLLPWALGLAGLVYGVPALGLGGWFLWLAVRVRYGTDDNLPRRLFAFSIIYLFLMFLAVAADRAMAVPR